MRIASDLDFKSSCFMFCVSLCPFLTIWNLYFPQCTSCIFKTVNVVCFYSNFLGNPLVWIYYFVIAVAHKVNVRCRVNKCHFLTVPFLCKLKGNKSWCIRLVTEWQRLDRYLLLQSLAIIETWLEDNITNMVSTCALWKLSIWVI